MRGLHRMQTCKQESGAPALGADLKRHHNGSPLESLCCCLQCCLEAMLQQKLWGPLWEEVSTGYFYHHTPSPCCFPAFGTQGAKMPSDDCFS